LEGSLALGLFDETDYRERSEPHLALSSNPIFVVARQFAAACVLLSILCLRVIAAAPPLTTAAEILALPPERSGSSLPVLLTGVVTVAESNWEGKFFLQDTTGGIFVNNLHGEQPKVGDLVQVEGNTGPGAFAPTVHIVSKWTKLGTSALPPAKQVTIEHLMAGGEDSQRVEISGLVRSVHLVTSGKLVMETMVGGYRVNVFPKISPLVDPQSFIAARIRVRGTAAASFNGTIRRLTAVNLYAPTEDDLVVEESEAHSPFTRGPLPLKEIALYRPGNSLGQRIYVRGRVTCQRIGRDFFIQDDTGGLQVQSIQPTALAPGQVVETAGFLGFANFQPILEDAVFRTAASPASPVPAKSAPIAELRDGLHQGELIVLKGRLLDRIEKQIHRHAADFSGVDTICTIQNSDLTFIAECEERDESGEIKSIPLGSLVELTGVSSLETGEDGKLKYLTLLLPDSKSIRILETPSWFTPRHLLASLAGLCILLAGVVGWTLTISKKNTVLHFLVLEKEKAQREIQEAHDLLEQRVKERTEQLKFETTARKEAELEFKAVLAERTRLARELHDTLEQALTGIALQLDTAAKLFLRSAGEATHHLELARSLMKQSQVELRRSIWDLRSRELEQFDLASALARAGSQMTDGTNIRTEMETKGETQTLPEIVEENLLRIGQEALTNVLKHSEATLVNMRLEFAPSSVSLEIKDNGIGFSHGQMEARGRKHFGLLGMLERAKRLDGKFSIVGSPGEGARVRVVIPLPKTQPVA
jgi:signal transduction histidine kinase